MENKELKDQVETFIDTTIEEFGNRYIAMACRILKKNGIKPLFNGAAAVQLAGQLIVLDSQMRNELINNAANEAESSTFEVKD